MNFCQCADGTLPLCLSVHEHGGARLVGQRSAPLPPAHAFAIEVIDVPGGLHRSIQRQEVGLDGDAGEHGESPPERGFLLTKVGGGPVDRMRSIKRALDPANIMNPRKIFPM